MESEPITESAQKARQAMVDIAQAMLAGAIDLLEGCRTIANLTRQPGVVGSTDRDILTFVAVDSETEDLPTGLLRELWAVEALADKDRQRNEYMMKARPNIEEACRALIQRYS